MNVDLSQALKQLGLTDADLAGCRQAPTLAIAKERLERIKHVGKRAYRRLALDLHPDRTNGDEAKTELFKRLTTAYETLANMEIGVMVPRAPQLVIQCVGISVSFGGYRTSTSVTDNWPSSGWSGT
jgi:hypothetical protein